MNENFVSYELAVKLKEKGFNEDCYTVYNTATMRLERSLTTWKGYKGVILAPTISQVLKWLREEHQIHIYIEIVSSGWVYDVLINVKKFEDGTWWYNRVKYEGYFDSFELASLAGINYTLDNLI